MRVQLLNHAAVVLETCGVRILCDPWLQGTCFAGGWGLKFDNPTALEECRRCTHLWISHFHGDHFHIPTLKRVLEINPSIQALGNRSHNFQLDDALRGLGFANVISLPERKEHALTDDVVVTRFPTTGIDNMLLVRSAQGSLLNYNDCNLPRRARKSLARKIGPVDVLLNNFNHAGKIIEFPEKSPEEIKQGIREAFLTSCRSFETKWIIPFASYHYYRAPETQTQNESLLSLREIARICPNAIPLDVGQAVAIDANGFQLEGNAVSHEVPPSLLVREGQVGIDELGQAFRTFKRRINFSFGGLTWFLPILRVYLPDADRTLSVSMMRGVKDLGPGEQDPHIRAHSDCVLQWFSQQYGTDSFWVGGHFELCRTKLVPLRWQFLVSLMTENRVDLWSLLRACFTPSGWRFLWCRREEIWAILFARRFFVGSRD